MSRVLVLDIGYRPVNVCTVRRAVVLLLKEKAEVVEHGDEELHAEVFSITRPLVIRLVVYVRVPRNTRRRVARRAIIARDQGVCQYCGESGHLTVDHVIPRSRGGQTEWTNVVACCRSCNGRKGNSLPREAGMKLARTPRTPAALSFVFVAVKSPPDAWTQWLFR